MDIPRNALKTRLAIEREHPEIWIRTPLTSPSRKWELTIDDNGTSFYDDFWSLAQVIADRYPDVKPLVDDRGTPNE